tara:strand:- start:40504 stop:41028 length:525 start_codon:yes stop_codon:yes gene_type:complete
MPEDVYVTLQYQGIELGSQLCMQEFSESQAYVQCPQPMPVGSSVVLCIDEDLKIPVQVARVSEQVAGTERPAGMFVGAVALDGAAQAWWRGNISEASAASAASGAEQSAEPKQAKESDGPDTDVMDVVTPEEVAEAKEAKAKETKAKEEEASAAAETPAKGKKKRRRRRTTRNK